MKTSARKRLNYVADADRDAALLIEKSKLCYSLLSAYPDDALSQ